MRYLANGFLLIAPLLLFNAVFTARLPPGYQPGVWDAVPSLVAVPEIILRLPVMALPLLLPISLDGLTQRVGAVVYLVGAIAYLVSWTVQILRPTAAWSTSTAGFLAPAYTPALWLAGVGLMGTHPVIPRLPYLPWIFLGAAAAFLAFHILHAALALQRYRGNP